MLGLFGTLSMASRSLQTQRNGTEVAGHNLANVNTPGYSRQRVAIETSWTIPSELGPQGTGADAVAIVQIRDILLDRQIVSETSVRGAYESKQQALQFLQAALGQQIDRQATGAEGAAAANGVGGQHGIAEQMSDLFASFQSLSTNVTSVAERQVLILKAQGLATQFNQVSQRLTDARSSLNDSVTSDVQQANLALHDIAQLNDQIRNLEIGGRGQANDLRDTRQKRIEDLAKLVPVQTTTNPNGTVDLAIDGVTLVSGSKVQDTLETYDAGGGQMLVRTVTGGMGLNITGGSIQGTIETRDVHLATLQTNLDTLASNLISEVNAVHATGYSLNGTSGQNFFTGSTAADIGVNDALVNDPSAIQASGVAGAPGDNTVAVALAQLADKSLPALSNQTLLQNYGQTVAALGQSLNSTNTQLTNQQIVERMLLRQRDSVSGVSIDEEMTDLIKFQRAFEASAKLITTVDTMLETVVNLKR
ncbi:MAG TPA: flagellar hook-associated protein FlgK [Verrucomicrobiae bacterium]|nr:flagellar hook-associated protein FlgK [Verrucomicrobiae bacterium]